MRWTLGVLYQLVWVVGVSSWLTTVVVHAAAAAPVCPMDVFTMLTP